MSETLITWPDVCVFCGDSNGKVGRTANEHWKQFRCGTEYEVIEGKTAWIQDDECKIAELRTALAAATKRAEEAEADLHRAVIEWTAKLDESEDRWAAAEKARDAYNDMRVIALEEVAGCRDRIKEYREKVEQLETDKAFYHDKWLNALERLKAAEQEDARMSKRLSMDALESDVAALLAQPKGGPDA